MPGISELGPRTLEKNEQPDRATTRHGRNRSLLPDRRERICFRKTDRSGGASRQGTQAQSEKPLSFGFRVRAGPVVLRSRFHRGKNAKNRLASASKLSRSRCHAD